MDPESEPTQDLTGKAPYTEIDNLLKAIAGLEALRGQLGDAVVNAGIKPMQEKLLALQKIAATGQQRKHVTVLFADISGFTQISESTDAEDLTEAINSLWKLVDTTILEHGGTIDKHMGDGVLAVWGMVSSREDDPERAIQAALSMQQLVMGLNLTIQNKPVRLRVGVHSGPVFVSQIGLQGEYTVMGDTVNTASRIQHLAPVGKVIISHETYQHVRGIFVVQAKDPVKITGKAEAIQVYEVQEARVRAFHIGTRGIEGVTTRMVGREAELQVLKNSLVQIEEDGQRRVVGVIGDAGIGKSRLLYEFENWLELRSAQSELRSAQFRYLKGRASPEMQNTPYALIRDMFALRFQIQDSDPSKVVWQKWERGIEEVFGPGEENRMRAHFIAQLLGYDFASSPYLASSLNDLRQMHERALYYLHDYFLRLIKERTTIVFFEDIHWADSSSLSLVAYLGQNIQAGKLLIVYLARPTLFERFPGWLENLPTYTRLNLMPLSRDDSRQLVAELLKKAGEVPDALRELVVSGADGNPYYVEELIKMLIEDGVIVKGETHWHIEPKRLVQVRIPATLTGVLQARLDSLSANERVVLQQASVIGRIFWDAVLSYLNTSDAYHKASVSELPPTLGALSGRELIFRRNISIFSDTEEYIFKHAVLRDVTYESVLKRERRAYHRRVADWLIEHTGERINEVTGLIADHLELAGNTQQAATFLIRAGKQAANQFANLEALDYLSRALKLLSETDRAARFEVLLAREQVYDLQGMRAEQLEDLLALQDAADAIQDERQASRRAAVALRSSNYAEITSDYPKALCSAELAVEQAQAAQDGVAQAEGYLLWARAFWRTANYNAAVEKLDQTLALARKGGARQIEAHALRMIGAIAFHQGIFDRFQEPSEEALRIYREIGDRRGAGSTLNNIGEYLRQQGDYAQAKEHFEQALHLSREIGEKWSESIILCNLSLISWNLGQYEEAKAYSQRGLQLSEAIGYRSAQATALYNLGLTLEASGALEKAAQMYQRSVEIRREVGESPWVIESLSGLAHLALMQGDLAKAQGIVEEVLHFLEQGSLAGCDEPFRVYLNCYQVLLAGGDGRAKQIISTAYALLMQQAERFVNPEQRRLFLENVAIHAEIVYLNIFAGQGQGEGGVPPSNC